MKCLIFSDTHGDSSLIYKALALHNDAEVLFFLGDGLSDIADLKLGRESVAVIAVKGNCDFRSQMYDTDVKKTEVLELIGKRIVMTHGDLFNVKMGTALVEKFAEDMGADIMIFGHTHQKIEKYIDVQQKYAQCSAYADKVTALKNYYLFNPGAASGYDRSYGVLTLTETACLFSHGK